MTNELKPVQCGCGGEAKIVDYLSRENCQNAYYVFCKVCGMQTAEYLAEAEAVEAWNTAMGAHTTAYTTAHTTERTAKVVHKQTDVNGMPWGKCGECNNLVFGNYCSECGAKMEWE